MPLNDDNTAATLQQFLVQAGIPAGAFSSLIDQAIRLNYTPSEFTLQVYGSPQFENMFPGIFRPDGSMKMTPYEYRQMSDQYVSTARQFGVSGFSQEHVGALIQGDVSMQEFSDRMTAIARIEDYKPAMNQFISLVEQNGGDASELKTDEGLVDFMLGRSSKKFYTLWDQTVVGTAAKESGVHISNDLVRRIAKRTPGVADEAQMQAGFQELASKIQTLLPLSRINKYGLSKKDLVTLEFGGPNQAHIAKKVDMIVKNYDAQFAQNYGGHLGQPDIGTVKQEKAQVA